MRYLEKFKINFNPYLFSHHKILLLALSCAIFATCFFIFDFSGHVQKYKSRTINFISKNILLSNQDLKVVIKGLVRSDKKRILNIVKKYTPSNKSLDVDSLTSRIKKSEKWIDSIHIFRSLPNSLNINIIEFSPFAIWSDESSYFVVDSNGNKISVQDINDFDSLLILSGNDAYSHVKSLFNLMVINPDISSRIYSATWVGNRRWDLRLDNSVLVKLPAEKISDSWSRLVELFNSKGSFYNLKSIDLRVKGKIYLEYKS